MSILAIFFALVFVYIIAQAATGLFVAIVGGCVRPRKSRGGMWDFYRSQIASEKAARSAYAARNRQQSVPGSK